MGSLANPIARAIRDSTNILVFTGAGVSVSSGIPDFRSQNGIWNRIDPTILTPQYVLGTSRQYIQFWSTMCLISQDMLTAQPNSIHRAVTTLEQHDRLLGVVTQNIDGLHQKAGTQSVVELHGNGDQSYCVDCGTTYATQEVFEWMRTQQTAPQCPACDGRLRPRVVLFGDPLPTNPWLKAVEWAQTCDVCLVLGSGLEVYPAADVPVIAHRSGAQLWILTKSSTPVDHLAHQRSHAPLEGEFVNWIQSIFEQV